MVRKHCFTSWFGSKSNEVDDDTTTAGAATRVRLKPDGTR